MANSAPSSLLFFFLLPLLSHTTDADTVGLLYQRETVVSTEYGHISAVTVPGDGHGMYHLRFITLRPNALLLPLLLHSDMVFYIASGSGSLSWAKEEETRRINLTDGDIYRLSPGTVFFLQSYSELQLHAIFPHFITQELSLGPYSSLVDVVLGFDKKILQASLQVTEDVIEDLVRLPKPQPIVEAEAEAIEKVKKMGFEENKKKTKTYNIFREKPDFQNCNGWRSMVTAKKLHVLKGSRIGVFVVNLTRSSMVGPHWNSMAMEIATATEGKGMVQVVCAGGGDGENEGFLVEEDEVFVVQRYRPVAQMSFNNGSFVFMGFTAISKSDSQEFLSGKKSVLRVLDRSVLALSFNVSRSVIERAVGGEDESTIFECISCAEVVKERQEEEEEKRQKQEEERRQEEEEREGEEREKEKEREEGEKEGKREEEKASGEEEKASGEEEGEKGEGIETWNSS